MSDKCGTYAGYQTHGRQRTPPCEPCRKAQAAYVKSWRQRHPRNHEREQQHKKARWRALARLADENPLRFLELMQEEMAVLRQEATTAGG